MVSGSFNIIVFMLQVLKSEHWGLSSGYLIFLALKQTQINWVSFVQCASLKFTVSSFKIDQLVKLIEKLAFLFCYLVSQPYFLFRLALVKLTKDFSQHSVSDFCRKY